MLEPSTLAPILALLLWGVAAVLVVLASRMGGAQQQVVAVAATTSALLTFAPLALFSWLSTVLAEEARRTGTWEAAVREQWAGAGDLRRCVMPEGGACQTCVSQECARCPPLLIALGFCTRSLLHAADAPVAHYLAVGATAWDATLGLLVAAPAAAILAGRTYLLGLVFYIPPVVLACQLIQDFLPACRPASSCSVGPTRLGDMPSTHSALAGLLLGLAGAYWWEARQLQQQQWPRRREAAPLQEEGTVRHDGGGGGGDDKRAHTLLHPRAKQQEHAPASPHACSGIGVAAAVMLGGGVVLPAMLGSHTPRATLGGTLLGLAFVAPCWWHWKHHLAVVFRDEPWWFTHDAAAFGGPQRQWGGGRGAGDGQYALVPRET